MSRPTILTAFLLCTHAAVFCGEWVPVSSEHPRAPLVRVVSSNVQETVLRVAIPGYHRRNVTIDGKAHAHFSLPRGPHLMKKGWPELPFVTVNVAIPDGGRVGVSIDGERAKTVEVPHYVPSKGHLPRTIDPASVPHTFSEAYQKDALWPGRSVAVGDPFVLRNVRGATVRVCPFQYNPVKGRLKIFTSLTLRVKTNGGGGGNVVRRARRRTESSAFLSLYHRRFINYGQHATRYPSLGETGRMLIITNDAFHDAMLPLLYWKRQKGIPTEMVKLSTVGTTASDVQTRIQNVYNTTGVSFVLLVGDAAQMPYLTGTAGNVTGNAADPRYVLLAGSDSYPDAFISRFPAQTTTEVSTMVNRTINYEKTPSATADWYHLGCGIASSEGSPADYTRMDWLRSDLLGYTYTAVDQIYDPGASSSQVTAALNSGRSIVNYLGHGSETAWGTTDFSVSSIYGLNNTNKVPFIFDVACLNGQFNWSGGDCFAEAWLKAGSPDAPKGALGIYASSTNQDWVPPCVAQAESIDRLADDTYHTFGALCFNGVMKGIETYGGTTGDQLYQQWHLFGDCAAMVFTDTPAAMTVSHDGTMVIGQSDYAVTVNGVEGALCALYSEATHTLHGSAYTNAAGQATIPLAPPPPGGTTLRLTVTAFNRRPSLGVVNVAAGPGRFLAMIEPNGGEAYEIGDAVALTWSAYGSDWATGDTVHLELSRDGGTSWSTIPGAASLAHDLGSFSWDTAAQSPCTQSRVRVIYTGDSSVNDTSNASFTIKERQLDHFVWDAIPAPQYRNVPFDVTITAKDPNGNTVTTYAGSAALSGQVGRAAVAISEVNTGSTDAVELTNICAAAVDVSGWQISIYDANSWPSPLVTFTIPGGATCQPGHVVTLKEYGTAPGAYPSFFLGMNIWWTSTSRVAVLLQDGSGDIMDFVCAAGATASWISSPIGIPAEQWAGSPISSSAVYQRKGNTDNNNSSDWSRESSHSIGTVNTGLSLPFADAFQSVAVAPAATTAFSAGVWTGQVTVLEEVPEVHLHVEDDGGHFGDSNAFAVSPMAPLTVVVPERAREGDGVVQGSVSVLGAVTAALLVDLASSDTSEAQVPGAVTIVAGQSTASFHLTVVDDADLDGTQDAEITASATGYVSGADAIAIQDNESGTLMVTVPESASEGAGELASQGMVTLDVAPATDVLVSLSADDTTEVRVPADVTIPAGQTAGTFSIFVQDDDEIDGAQTVTITAHVPGWTDGSDTIGVLDDDGYLTVALPAQATEGDGLLAGVGTVGLGGTLTTELVVSLVSDDATEATVPATVTIPAGQTQRTFDVTIVDDDERDGAQTATVAASAAALTGASTTITVADNDVHHFSWFGLAASQTAGVAFGATIIAEDVDGATMLSYTGIVALSGSGDSGPVAVAPATSTAFSSGEWTGSVTVNAVDANVRLTADDGSGHAGTSKAFDVEPGPLDHFVWDAIASPQCAGAPLAARVEAKDARGYIVTSFTGTVGLAGHNVSGAVAVSPTVSGSFAAGVWADSVTVLEVAVDLCLRADDGSGHTGESNAFTARPIPPVLAAEPDYTVGASNTVHWSSVSTAEEYQAQCSVSQDFGSHSDSDWVTGLDATFDGLTADQRYWYRVKAAKGVAGSTGTWTQTSKTDFEGGALDDVDVVSPGNVVLASSSGGEQSVVSNPSFEASSLSPWTTATTGNYTARRDTNGHSGMPTSGSAYLQIYTHHYKSMQAGNYGRASQSVELTDVAFLECDVFLYSPVGWQNKVRAEIRINGNVIWSETAGGQHLGLSLDVSGYTGVHTLEVRSVVVVPGTFGSQWVCCDNIRTYGATGYASSGTVVSTTIAPSPLLQWGTLTFTKDVSPVGTTLTVDVLSASDDLLLENVASGTDLHTEGLTASGVKLRANLATTNSANTPTLEDWTVTWQATPDVRVESAWSNVESSTQVADPFQDAGAGLPGLCAGSLRWGDYDSDGDLDLAVAGTTDGLASGALTRVYRNDGASFTDIDAGLISVYRSALAWGDYDSDGDLDLFVAGNTSADDPVSKLYRNDGAGAFTDVAAAVPGVYDCSAAWGDYDHDGDLDLVVAGYAADRITEIYRNDGSGAFTDSGASLVGVSRGCVAWADYDSDGDLDLAIAGQAGAPVAKVYRNENGTFTDVDAGLTGVSHCSLAWGDYDGDGDLDLAIAGTTDGLASGAVAKVYQNASETFTDIQAGLTGAYQCSLAWGDYDNDGDLDLAVAGQHGAEEESKVYRNYGSDGFMDFEFGLVGVSAAAVAWGDCDHDGDLDLALAGSGGAGRTSRVYRNDADVHNTVPTTPTGLSATVAGSDVTIGWDLATDKETSQDALSYNLRIGTYPGADDLCCGMADPSSGLRRVPAMGNAQLNGCWMFRYLPPGTYYWSVQAIDAAFAGSAYAPEQSFTVQQCLGLTIGPAGWHIPGIRRSGDVCLTDESARFVIRNTGNVKENLGLRISVEDDKGKWRCDGPGADRYRLSARLQPAPPSAEDFAESDRLLTDIKWCDTTKFAGGGKDMAPKATTSKWLRFDTPTAVTDGEPHTIAIEVRCQKSN